jgi:hypothetical protein
VVVVVVVEGLAVDVVAVVAVGGAEGAGGAEEEGFKEGLSSSRQLPRALRCLALA